MFHDNEPDYINHHPHIHVTNLIKHH